MTVIESFPVDLEPRLAPARSTRHEFYRQIALLEREVSAATAELELGRRPRPNGSRSAKPHVLTDAELESVRDSLVAQLNDVERLRVQQEADHAEARALLKRMSEVPAAFPWTKVTTKELGDGGCRTWQSVPVLGPVGLLGNWWRIRMSSGCP